MSSSAETLERRAPLLSIILVTCSSATALDKSLPVLAGEISRSNLSCELVVCDNASRDHSVELVRRHFPRCIVVSQERNLGFAAGCNRAVERARGELTLFLNPDVLLDEGALNGLVERYRELPNAGAVVGRMRNPDGSFQATCREFPNKLNIFASRGSSLRGLFSFLRYTLPDFEEITPVPAAAATCWLMARSDFVELGGFDERFFMFMEDTDISRRIADKGKLIYYIPSAGAVHAWGEGGESSSGERYRWHSESTLKYFRKHHPGVFSTVCLPLALKVNQIVRSENS